MQYYPDQTGIAPEIPPKAWHDTIFFKKKKTPTPSPASGKNISNADYQEIMEQAKRCRANGAAWHNHYLPPDACLTQSRATTVSFLKTKRPTRRCMRSATTIRQTIWLNWKSSFLPDDAVFGCLLR
jgi:hypothetical protein